MKIEYREITVRDLVEGYEDNEEMGVRAYGGTLDVRPPYQREFVYKDAQRDAVINTVRRGFPLNVMYWAVREDGTYEIIDGQQRTISLCQFVEGDFSFQNRYFHNLEKDEEQQVLDYRLTVYLCSGTDSEKLDWFRTINIAGEELTNQELRNAVYAGSWVTDAKRYFSKQNCPALAIGGDFTSKSAIRQELLETVIRWINDGDVEGYMALNQHKPDAHELWVYFQNVITWVTATFPVRRRVQMRSVQWGYLYNEFKDADLDPAALEQRVSALLADDEVTRKYGVYAYVLTGEERHLNLRAFTEAQKTEAFERQKGVCTVCNKTFQFAEMEADHITPWSKGGKTIPANCAMLCKDDNRRKSGV